MPKTRRRDAVLIGELSKVVRVIAVRLLDAIVPAAVDSAEGNDVALQLEGAVCTLDVLK